eukprot:CAMPEP_0176366384 /NCGR_PEP_ID=MMETSP0126-20121128/21142_1 /TAXON_ID=141414 ORGANISM="Strombidinopsis acuminatum, Strain SPMC142" /NCGR_SAMPLE_ID=MMETSP0126 /ASSEMBLY_ACC=CAM_ASM_000229 /LENGTH=180 /DNA_ID=CAMNT_0017723783 /DNA_START=23 /DNA_END=569 /DNA_ORIENTATION=-
MVYFFTSAHNPNVIIYMGKDKYENEDLIKYSWPHDIWWHVDNLSSAHVYLRMDTPINHYSEIPQEIIADAPTKKNSIEGCKKAAVGINYTWARNLKKQIGMETGAVTFHDSKQVARINCQKDTSLSNKIMKTKKEAFPNLELELRDHMKDLERMKNKEVRDEKQAKKEEENARHEAIVAK